MSILKELSQIKVEANSNLDSKKKSALGQFFTPDEICLYMSSLFHNINDNVKLLDPGCGPCSLTASFLDEAILRQNCTSLTVNTFDIEEKIVPQINKTLEICNLKAIEFGLQFNTIFKLEDFILKNCNNAGLFTKSENYTHVIMNPPYKKIPSSSAHRKALRTLDIETVNLYSGFIALAIKQLRNNGELVAIIPRSCCNGPYYQPFRELLLKETSIEHIHIFDSRTNAFSEDKVLQENIIIHLVKGKKQGKVNITSSPNAGFHRDASTNTITVDDMTTRTVSFNTIVKPSDKNKFIHIAANNRDQNIINKLSVFNTSLKDLDIEISTGPVVGFRLKDDLCENIEDGAVPLIFPQHLNGSINWPIKSKNPNAIRVTEKSRPWLWKNSGSYVLVRRLSSKEELRRIVATPYNSTLNFDLIGFENKLNVFHKKKSGIDKDIAYGLNVYLNSTLLDQYYRQFGGHTQVNSSDLKNILYPNIESLKRLGKQSKYKILTQYEIDNLIKKEIFNMTGQNDNPLDNQEKITQAIEILTALDMPKAQQNERSALTLLAILNLAEQKSWKKIECPLMGVTPIMDWCRDVYGKEYAANTRETFRRQTLHQFVDGGLCLYNPDEPDRAVNSPKACYQIAPELYEVLKKYGTKGWTKALGKWLDKKETLSAQYAMEREMHMIPLTLDDGTEIKLSAGIHSQLIHDIVTEFGPRFAPGAEVIYLGDTGAKEDFFKKERLEELGVTVDRKGKLPDVVLYFPDKDWLLLVESVTSHGPVDGKRYSELTSLFFDSKPGLVYVTAFPDRKVMGKYITEISWETEVWTADAPTHMIHFNGDRFLGPH